MAANPVVELARAEGRDYITPEDVATSLEQGISADTVRLAVLEVLAKQCGMGAEDASLCAFIAWQGHS